MWYTIRHTSSKRVTEVSSSLGFVRSSACLLAAPGAFALQALADSDHRARRPAAATSRGEAPARQPLGCSIGRQTASGTSVGRRRSAAATALRALLAWRLSSLAWQESRKGDQVPLVVAPGFAASDKVLQQQIIARVAGDAEGEHHDNLPSMELIDFGLNNAPRSLT
jgi:hypothetical protein